MSMVTMMALKTVIFGYVRDLFDVRVTVLTPKKVLQTIIRRTIFNFSPSVDPIRVPDP